LSTFLLLYTAVYGGMNAYLFLRLRQAFGFRPLAGSLLALFFAFMVAAPVLTRLLEKEAALSLARALGLVGYTWMGVAFWLVLLFWSIELWNLLARGAALVAPVAKNAVVPLRGAALGVLALTLFAVGAGVWEAEGLRLEETTVASAALPAGSPPIRIAFLSDLHVDHRTSERRLRKVVELVHRARPDLVLSGGDLVDGNTAHLGAFARVLAELSPPLGKFAVPGNHEHYVGIEASERFTEEAGFRMLRGASAVLELPGGGRLLVVGVDDPASRRFAGSPTASEDDLLPPASSRPAVVLLKHQPLVDAGSLGRFDVQLSGHTHGGQIYPFRYFVRLRYPLPDGLSALGQGSLLYKGRGTGTWGPPFRLFARPEVTLVQLVPGDGRASTPVARSP
jgi:uncharacterized protein